MTAAALGARARTGVWLIGPLVAVAVLVEVAPRILVVVAAVAFLAGVGATIGVTATSVTLLAAYLVPLFAFGRSFSRIGFPPFQLPELLLVAALAASVSSWWSAYKTRVPRWYKLSTSIFASLALVSVVRGAAAGYPSAPRGFALVVYPLVSAPVAAWIAVHRKHWDGVLGVAVAAAPVGLVLLSVLSRTSIVAAAYALYLSGLVGVAITIRRVAMRRLLIGWAAVGALVLAATGRRGPLLALTVCSVVGFISLTGYRPPQLSKVIATVAFAVVSGLCIVVLGAVHLADLPGIGAVVERTQRGFSDPGSPEEANVAFRVSVWRYAVATVTKENPLFGVGFGRPFSLRFRDRDFAKEQFSGAHNSYVGVAYAAGFPAALLFVGLFVGAAATCLRKPRTDRYRTIQVAWLASAALIALTNVAAETTYIGGPLWILLGWICLRSGSDDEGGGTVSVGESVGLIAAALTS